MIYPHNYKSVFVLDHGAKFLQSSNEDFEFDVTNKNKASIIPLAPLSKSHWTSSIEAGLEFCRIVYDIFGKKKRISFLASDAVAHQLSGWTDKEQELDYIQRAFGLLGLPRKASRAEGESSIMHGLYAGLDQLLTPTQTQNEKRIALLENADSLQNNGRIICITMAKTDSYIDEVIKRFAEALEIKNREAFSSDEMLPIHNCELVIVIIHPVGSATRVSARSKYEVSPTLSVTVETSESGRSLANRMVALAVSFYQLVITSVTGIPMKEEQNANSSANYDVELLHSSEAHSEMNNELAEGCRAPSKEIKGVDSVTLKWCTPKSSSNNDIQQCMGTFPISPVDANSRPSLCLTNFLLGGRSVMLEQPRKSGSKFLSHMLTSHGGQIYIHQLVTGKSILDDPPSISEGPGGRVIDYRIQDFGEIIRTHGLKPVIHVEGQMLPIMRAEGQLDRSVRCFPLTIGETMIFNLQSHIEPLPKILPQELLTDHNVNECRQAIFQLLRLEEQNLLGAYSAHKGKKKEEHSRQMWSELEELVRAHADTSAQHNTVLQILLNCKPAGSGDDFRKRRNTTDSRQTDSKPGTPNSEASGDSRSKSLARADSPLPKKSKFGGIPFNFKSNQSLLTMWTTRMNHINNNRHEEFAGRANGVGNKAQLYKKMDEKFMEAVDDTTPGVKNCPDH